MRGAHLDAVKANGLTLRVGDAEFKARVSASDDPAALGPQDIVICTLKATALPSLTTGLLPLLGEDTAVVFAQDGIPWWYDMGFPQNILPFRIWPFSIPAAGCASDPKRADGRRRGVFVQRISAPGVARTFRRSEPALIGECDDRSERADRAAAGRAQCGSHRVAGREENPGDGLVETPDQHVDVGAVPVDRADRARRPRRSRARRCRAAPARRGRQRRAKRFPEVKRVTRSGPAPDHKPSILQDYELGRAMEIDVLVRAPAAFARAAGLSTPMLDFLAALAIRQARDKGLYQG